MNTEKSVIDNKIGHIFRQHMIIVIRFQMVS